MRKVSAISLRKQVTFQWYIDVRFVLYQHALVGSCIVVAHWNNSPWIDMSIHLNILFLFRANQSLIVDVLMPHDYRREATNTNFIVFGLSRGEHTNHYTTDAVPMIFRKEQTTIYMYLALANTLLHMYYILKYLCWSNFKKCIIILLHLFLFS